MDSVRCFIVLDGDNHECGILWHDRTTSPGSLFWRPNSCWGGATQSERLYHPDGTLCKVGEDGIDSI